MNIILKYIKWLDDIDGYRLMIWWAPGAHGSVCFYPATVVVAAAGIDSTEGFGLVQSGSSCLSPSVVPIFVPPKTWQILNQRSTWRQLGVLSCQISQIHRGPSIPGPSSAETPGRPWTACGDVGSLRRERIPTQRRCCKSKSRIRRFWCRSAWNPSLGEFRENWIRRRNCGIIEALRWRNSKLPGMVLENVISEEFAVVFQCFSCVCSMFMS